LAETRRRGGGRQNNLAAMTHRTNTIRRARWRQLWLASQLASVISGSIGCSSVSLEELLLEARAPRQGREHPSMQPPVILEATGAWSAGGAHYLIAATTGQPAIEAGLAVLEAGGNALDAALSIALDQIVLSGGSWNSLAGIASLVYFDAASGRAHSLDGSYRSFAEEREPGSIPGAGTPSGRTALVPGFPALLQAAHDRFGELGFERLFDSAIAHAEAGIVVNDVLAAVFASRADVLTLLPATAAVYAPSGVVPRAGEVFRQPALAETLRRVAREGARAIYRGAWARHFVDAVRAQGGRVTIQDLEGYVAEWSEPRCVSYADHPLCSAGGRNRGGGALLESLLVAEVVGLPALGDTVDSADALYWTIRALQVGSLLHFAPELTPTEPFFLSDRLDGIERSIDARLEPEQARRLVEHVVSGRWDAAVAALSARIQMGAGLASSSHSDGVVVVDAAGNAATLIHSSNTVNWGTTGLNVDGVSIPDSASFQQGALVLAGPGAYLGSQLDPALAFDAGRLRWVASSVGNIQYAMFGYLSTLLSSGRSLEHAIAQPVVSGAPYAELVAPGSFPAALLDAVRDRGLRVSEGVDENVPIYWLGIDRAPPDAGPEQRSTGVVTPALVRYGGGVAGD
jgi:gamma-glutamyltranspeptidase/glutathione hydrolase